MITAFATIHFAGYEISNPAHPDHATTDEGHFNEIDQGHVTLSGFEIGLDADDNTVPLGVQIPPFLRELAYKGEGRNLRLIKHDLGIPRAGYVCTLFRLKELEKGKLLQVLGDYKIDSAGNHLTTAAIVYSLAVFGSAAAIQLVMETSLDTFLNSPHPLATPLAQAYDSFTELMKQSQKT